jgi:transcriptional regulator GlxA family with amidase domain
MAQLGFVRNDNVPTISAMTHIIAFVIFDDFQILDAAGPIAAFEIAERYRPGSYEVRVVATRPGDIASSSRVRMTAGTLGDASDFDTVLVAGGDGSRTAVDDQRLLTFVRIAAAAGRRVASVCSGAFILAQAGVLNGRCATTHWSRSADFARLFPDVRLQADRIWTRDGDIWTSAGITAGIDLALAMIAEDLGETVAKRTAQQLVVYHRRPGGQSQFSALLEMESAAGRFSSLLSWARENLDQSLTVEQLAARAVMSPRHFARAFVADTGVTPARAVERLRLEAARAEVEGSSRSMARIARDTGFRDAERMRRAFVRSFGQPPQALRRTTRPASSPVGQEAVEGVSGAT